ncbi:hypothetical protein RND71_028935 [Anisodus tanguticus]|uniref:Cytochrome P450 n=1 Tax=Anisodus tanguticus TaxID=243964 RepID=A0AAE1RMC9_9SOLA|nr:hypothetical protein RND71_028935 [Anisodus tanguticus]
MDSFSTSSLSPYYHLIFTFLAFVISGLIFLFSKKNKSKKLNFPPGPPGWPVVGNLFQVARSGKPFFQYVRELRPKYGSIFTLRMGTRTMIIVSNADLVHEALVQKGQVFSSRPRENPTRTVFSCDKFTVNAAVYGPVWRSLRKNMVQNGLSSMKLKEFRAVRQTAMDKMIEKIRAEARENDGVVWVLKNARFAVFCILLSMCFGVEMDEKTIEAIDQMMKTILMVLDPRLDDYLPILSPFFSKQRKWAMDVRKQQIETIMPFIEKRKKILENPEFDKTAASFSYLDTLLDLKVEVGEKVVDEKDIQKMSYLNAVIKELLRKHPPTYFSLTHAVIEPATLGGYDIPTDANVEIFLPGISDDPKLWSEPEKFDPDRFFLGKEDADITGVSGVKMIPFGMGRRICPGLNMATVHVSLMLARLVQEFEWSVYPEKTRVDFSEKLEFTVQLSVTNENYHTP